MTTQGRQSRQTRAAKEAKNMFQVGAFVLNFGRVGRIVEVRSDGLLILSAARVGKWVADPSKCGSY